MIKAILESIAGLVLTLFLGGLTAMLSWCGYDLAGHRWWGALLPAGVVLFFYLVFRGIALVIERITPHA